MHRKIISIFLSCLMLLSAVAFADPAPWAAYDSMHGQVLNRWLVRASGDGYEYFTYEPTSFDVYGQMGGIGADLDNDGAAEYLQVYMSSNNIASMIIYEPSGDGWTAAATTVLYEAPLTCNIAASDVFLKYDGDSWLIFNENWMQENCCADGAAWSFHAFSYADGQLQTLTATVRSGGHARYRTDWDLGDKVLVQLRLPALGETVSMAATITNVLESYERGSAAPRLDVTFGPGPVTISRAIQQQIRRF